MGLSMLFFIPDYRFIFWFLRHRVYGKSEISFSQWLKTSSNILFCHLSMVDLYLDFLCVTVCMRYAAIAKLEGMTDLEQKFILVYNL